MLRDIEILNNRLSMDSFKQILNKINVIRPVGSKNHTIVREVEIYSSTFFQFIERELRASGWEVTLDTFSEITIIGNLTFTNVIATINPSASRLIILSCHYESKMLRNFYGTIDSAVSCSIIVNIAKTLSELLHMSKVCNFCG